MKGKKAAAIALLLVWLALSFPLPTTSQSGIVVTGADSVQDTSTVHSPGLASSTQSVAPRVAVEYAHSTAPQALAEPPTTLRDLINSITERVVAEYANSTTPRALTEPPTALRDLINSITKRVVAEYASSTRAEEMAYPVGLLDDTTPPQISDIAANAVGNDSATITWTTDEFATSTVLYGTQSGAYSETVSDPLYVKQHEITLSELVPGTTYYYVVRSTDRSDNTATSAEQSFLIEPTSPVLSVYPTSLDFGATQTQKTFNISNAGGGTLTWSVSEDKTWLSVSPTSGTEDATITVNVDRSGLSTGDYTADIIVSSNGGNETVQVTIEVGGTCSISGRVTDGSGNPISGASISDGAGHTATTGSSGNYTLSWLTAGTYTIAPSKSGYTFWPASRTVSIPPDATGQDFTGYDKFPIVFVHGWGGFPPWGPCDWPDPNSAFESVDDELRAAGYYVAYAYLETSPCYTPPLIENVPCLRHAIALAKAATNQEKVILIAHSMGGLVSRAYIEGLNYDEDVAALFTFGSPHLGVPVDALTFLIGESGGLVGLGAYCALFQPAVCEFTTTGMILFNRDHSERAQDVSYHVISGDAPFFSRSALGMALDAIIPGSDDALIPTSSGTGLSGTLDRWETDEVHSKGMGSRTYFIRDGGQSTSYTQCLKPVLVDKTSNICGSVGTLQITAEAAPTLAQHTPFEYGTLLAGQTATRTISLEGGPTLFAAQWQTGTLALTLVDPSGQTIDPAYATSHPDVVTYDADATSATYYFPNAITGIWQLVLQARGDIPAGGSAHTTFVAFDSLLSLTAETDRDWYAPGASATITASLSGSPASAVVTATILRADGVTDTVSLSPLEAGQYRATYTVPDAPGYAEVRLVATGTTAGDVPFERGLSLAFQIASNTVTLSGVYSDTPQPRSPGSSLYEALTVTAGINAIISGTVSLSADLVDADGNFVAHSFTIEDVATGAGTLALRFDGDDIYASQRNGRYTLTNLLLTDRRGAALVVAEAENVYTTAAYDYLSFASANIYLPLILRNH